MKRIFVLTADTETILNIAIKRLKKIKGLHITQIGLDKVGEGDKDDNQDTEVTKHTR